MVEFELKQHDGRIYLPKELREILNSKENKAIANFRGAFLFDSDVEYEKLIKSLEIIKEDLEQRAEAQKLEKKSS